MIKVHMMLFCFFVVFAAQELTYDYNYKPGSVEGTSLKCHCGAANCRGVLL